MDQFKIIQPDKHTILAIELFKAKQSISTHLMNNIFQIRDNLRYNQTS